MEPHRLQQIRKLTEVSRALTHAASLDEMFQLATDRAADLLGAEKALLLVSNDEGLLTLRSSYGIDAVPAHRLESPMNEALLGRLAVMLDAPPESFLGVPLVVAGAIKGILVVIRPDPSSGAEHDEWLLSALADQAALALEKKNLDDIGEFREQLIGIVGHDLRNPLSTILIAAEFLVQSQGLGETETELSRKIIRSALQANRLIGQLLDLTRSRLGGGIPVESRRFDLNEVFRQLAGETELRHPDRPLHVSSRGDLSVVWDRDRIYQLLANLIGNAIQHGEARSAIELRVEAAETEVVIEVANRGEPIPSGLLPFIFDAFRKSRTVHAPAKHGGLGLGLFIAQQIARSHAGSITVTSSASDGTTLRVRLPRVATATTR